MKRREFINLAGTGIAVAGLGGFSLVSCKPNGKINWKKGALSKAFTQVECEGKSLVQSKELGLLNAQCQLISGNETFLLDAQKSQIDSVVVHARFNHSITNTFLGNGEDLLEGVLLVSNKSNQPLEMDISFTTGVQPSANVDAQKIYIPISSKGLNRDKRLAELGSHEFYQECEQQIGKGDFACHYLEPKGSNPEITQTKALLLAPVVDIQNPSSPWRVALFTPSEEPYEFATCKDEEQNVGWKAKRRITLQPGEEKEFKCWLLVHQDEADVAWHVFHQVAHVNEFDVPEWLKNVKVHYYDYLSAAAGINGVRGDGYEADIPYFNEFRVGLATQHAYYPYIGDFISPERKEWLAMLGDKNGPAKMSLDKMRDRIDQTRKTGAKAGIYMHTVLFDDASPLFDQFRGSILIDEQGQQKKFNWKGPDTAGQNWWMSFASEDWTNHLLKQAEYIMELLNPEAIVFDETFVCLGYEYKSGTPEPLSPYSIKFLKELRRLVHSYGDDKAVLTSDCGGTNLVMWADGDAGDHSYKSTLGNPLYRKEPIRYKAAIDNKPWVPCSWHFLNMWEEQMDLARKLGTGVGVSNGWIEYNGLHGLLPEDRERILKDIKSL